MSDSDALGLWLSSIGKESVQAFQDDFSGLTGMSLCLVHLDGAPALVASNRSLLCFHIEGRNGVRCQMQHRQFLARMMETGALVVDSCYAGLTCFACPVFRGKEVAGAFFGGMVSVDPPDSTVALDVARYEVKSMSRLDLEKALRLLRSTLSLLKGVRIASGPTIDETGRELMDAYGLSSREIMVIGQIVRGKSNLDIAEALFISEKTVKTHITNILKNTPAKNRYDLALLCKKYFDA